MEDEQIETNQNNDTKSKFLQLVIPGSLHRAIKVEAAKEDKTMGEIVVDLLSEKLLGHTASNAAASAPESHAA
jgi:predicted HicB family RNase H-like nuclease